jgi:hypothetical protein
MRNCAFLDYHVASGFGEIRDTIRRPSGVEHLDGDLFLSKRLKIIMPVCAAGGVIWRER